jgi:hypothetical protein
MLKSTGRRAFLGQEDARGITSGHGKVCKISLPRTMKLARCARSNRKSELPASGCSTVRVALMGLPCHNFEFRDLKVTCQEMMAHGRQRVLAGQLREAKPMNPETQSLLDAFERLADEEKRAFVQEAFRQAIPFTSGPLAGEEIDVTLEAFFCNLRAYRKINFIFCL